MKDEGIFRVFFENDLAVGPADGTKMAQEDLRQFVEDLFLPSYLERNS